MKFFSLKGQISRIGTSLVNNPGPFLALVLIAGFFVDLIEPNASL